MARSALLLPVDPATYRRACVALDEDLRLGRVPRTTLQRWMIDSIRERSHHSFTPSWDDDPRPVHHHNAIVVSDGFMSFTSYIW